MKKTKVSVKIKGTVEGVQKALAKLTPAEKPALPLREIDFRNSLKKKV